MGFLAWIKESSRKKHVHDWLNWFDMTLIRKMIDLSIDKSNLKVTAIDGSGIDTNFKSSYYKKRLNDFGEK